MLDMQDVETTTEFLIVRFTNKNDGEERVLGFFIQDGPAGTREKNSMIIKRCWEKIAAGNVGLPSRTEIQQDLEDRPVLVPGQRLSITDLFGRQVG